MFWFSFTSLRSGPAPIDWRIKLAAAKLVNKVDHLAAKESVTIPFCANGQYITGSHFGPDCGAACFQVKGRFLKKHSKTQSINMEWLVTKTAPELFREEVNDGSLDMIFHVGTCSLVSRTQSDLPRLITVLSACQSFGEEATLKCTRSNNVDLFLHVSHIHVSFLFRFLV